MRASPAASAGSQRSRNASLPACARATAGSTLQDSRGDASNERPHSRITTRRSVALPPMPPYASGTSMAGSPICTMRSRISRENPASLAAAAR